MKRRIRSGDTVIVVAGDERGKQGKVLRFSGDRVVVEGVNYIWKHLRKTQKTPQGGRVQKEAPIHVSNIMLLNTKTGKPERVGVRREDGKAVRVFRRSKQPVKAD